MENNILKIEDFLATGGNGDVVRRRKSPATSAIVLAVSVAMCVVALRLNNMDTLQMALLSVGMLAGLSSLTVFVLCFSKNTGHYVYSPTGSRLKCCQRYIATADKQRCLDAVSKGDASTLRGIRQECGGSFMLQFYCATDGSVAFVQCKEYVPHDFVPATPVVEFKGEEARLLQTL